jgi:hypothetical protein
MSSKQLTVAVDAQPPHSFDFPALSLSLAKVADSAASPTHVPWHTADLAAAGMAS